MSKKCLAQLSSPKGWFLGPSCDQLQVNAEKPSSFCSTILAGQPTTSSHMEQIVSKLAAKYAVDLSQRGASFGINQTNQPHRWLIANIDSERIGVTRCQVGKGNITAPELDIVFEVHRAGWEPVEIVYTPAVWQAYVKAAHGRPVMDAQGDFSFAVFADYYAQQLEAAAQREDKPTVDKRKARSTFMQNELSFYTRRNDKEIRKP